MSVTGLQCIEKTDKGYMVAIDAGQSMQYGGVLGCELITPLIASAAMAMLFVQSEPNYQVVAMSSAVEPLDVRCASSLTDICTAVSEVCVSMTFVVLAVAATVSSLLHLHNDGSA